MIATPPAPTDRRINFLSLPPTNHLAPALLLFFFFFLPFPLSLFLSILLVFSSEAATLCRSTPSCFPPLPPPPPPPTSLGASHPLFKRGPRDSLPTGSPGSFSSALNALAGFRAYYRRYRNSSRFLFPPFLLCSPRLLFLFLQFSFSFFGLFRILFRFPFLPFLPLAMFGGRRDIGVEE